ncbi:SRPBCC family protein [Nocardia sp. CDC160]|uniref:SRPBCC family protein n=1 Tax=Nocardia sp. CDC160 TaxID=3112166 RepID=UPI002DBE90A2|nr:SRPBCC family protein [Nocardia sp. CDC160]MEC3917845.1 SRPBCC family protein [Nocardia sp. CDC160]
MASITREILIDVPPDQVWEVVSDFINGPLRMAPDLVTATTDLGDNTREVTFTHGTVVRERLITLDPDTRRFVYSVYAGTPTPLHDNAVMQIFPHGDNASRFVWSRDLLPDSLAAPYAATMDQALLLFKKTLESK